MAFFPNVVMTGLRVSTPFSLRGGPGMCTECSDFQSGGFRLSLEKNSVSPKNEHHQRDVGGLSGST